MNKTLLWVVVGVGALVLLSRRAAAAPRPETTGGFGPPTVTKLSDSSAAIVNFRKLGPRSMVSKPLTDAQPLSDNQPTGDVAVDADQDWGKQLADFGNNVKGGLDTLLGLFKTGEEIAAKASEYIPEGDVYTKE